MRHCRAILKRRDNLCSGTTGLYFEKPDGFAFRPGQFANFILLTPQGCTSGPGSCPGQEFFEVMPEGGSAAMYLLLAGLSCFAAMLFRRRQAPAMRSSIG